MQVKLRYKKPTENKSKLITHKVDNKAKALMSSSNNFQFATAVAEFGLILRNSNYKGKASYKDVIEIANRSQGEDVEGYRREFLALVETCKSLSN